MILYFVLFSAFVCITSPAQGEDVVPDAHASSQPYVVLGLVPPAEGNPSQDNLLPKGKLLSVLIKGTSENPRVERDVNSSQHNHTHEHQHDHDHSEHNHDHTQGDAKKREKRGYCSRCGGQLGYGGGGYGGGGYGGYGGGCGNNCGGGRPIYQQPIYQRPNYGGGICNTCGQPYGGGGGGGYGGSYSQSSSSSSSSSGSYGKK